MERVLGSESDGTHRDGERGSGLRATVYHRAGARERDRTEAVLAELERISRRSALDPIEDQGWPDAVPMDGSSWPIDVYRSLAAWAERNGVSVEPPFRVTSVAPSRLHASDEILRTPEVCLTIWWDDEIRAVYPHTTEEGVVEIQDGLRRTTAALGAVTPDPGMGDVTPPSDPGDGAPTP